MYMRHAALLMLGSALVIAGGCQPALQQRSQVKAETPVASQSDAPPLSEREVQSVSVASPDGKNVIPAAKRWLVTRDLVCNF